MAELVKYESLKYARSEGRAEGLEEGIEIGFEQGIEKGIEQTIRSMMKQNIDLETISKVTNKSLDELKEIEKN